GVGLLATRQHTDRAIHYFAPRPAARRRRATVVDARDHVALIGEHPEPQPQATHPLVAHGLPGGLAVHVHQQRVGPRGIEVTGPDHPAVEGRAIRKRDAEEFAAARRERRDRLAQPLVRNDRAGRGVRGQAYQVGYGRGVERRVGVPRPARVWCDVVAVCPRSVGGRDTLRLPAAVERYTLQLVLGRVIGRGDVLQSAA